MEDRYVMLKIAPEMGSGSPVVIHAVLDGHGGEVRNFALFKFPSKDTHISMMPNLNIKMRYLFVTSQSQHVSCVHRFTARSNLKMGPTPASFSFIFVFSDKHFNTTNKYEKCPSSIRRWDSNSQPSDYKSPPLTTRPGLPPTSKQLRNAIVAIACKLGLSKSISYDIFFNLTRRL